jgi:hypothetical protein
MSRFFRGVQKFMIQLGAQVQPVGQAAVIAAICVKVSDRPCAKDRKSARDDDLNAALFEFRAVGVADAIIGNEATDQVDRPQRGKRSATDL